MLINNNIYRYANVIPLPETRVLLEKQGDDEKTEYINANYVRVSKNLRLSSTQSINLCKAHIEKIRYIHFSGTQRFAELLYRNPGTIGFYNIRFLENDLGE